MRDISLYIFLEPTILYILATVRFPTHGLEGVLVHYLHGIFPVSELKIDNGRLVGAAGVSRL